MMVLAAAGILAWAAPASAAVSVSAPDTGAEAAILHDTNAARASAGLGALSVASDLVANARSHAEAMASQQRLYDDANTGSEICCWQAWGENSGEGPSESAIEQAFMASAPHRANILGGYSQVGIGVVWTGSTMWVAEVFRLPSAPTPPPTQPPATQAPAPAPPPTQPPATQAPAPARTLPAVTAAPVTRPVVTAPPATAPATTPAPAPAHLPPPPAPTTSTTSTTPPTTAHPASAGAGTNDSAGPPSSLLRTEPISTHGSPSKVPQGLILLVAVLILAELAAVHRTRRRVQPAPAH